MQIPLLQTHAFFHTVLLVWNTLPFLSITVHYSLYAPGHRTVLKESKGSYGRYIHVYLWYSWQTTIGCKYHTATLELPETSNRSTHTSFSTAFFFSPLHLLVFSMLHISSFFFHLLCLHIYMQLFLLEKLSPHLCIFSCCNEKQVDASLRLHQNARFIAYTTISAVQSTYKIGCSAHSYNFWFHPAQVLVRREGWFKSRI